MSPVDEIRTARAIRALRKHAREHPEAFDPDRLPTTPTALATALDEPRIGRPPSDDPHLTLTVRAPRSLLKALDEARGARGRGEIVREALTAWLKTVRRRPRATND